MGLTQLEICNHALLKIGADTIDTLTEPASSEDGTKRSINLCNIFFDQAYDEVLRLYPWNSSTKRTIITLDAIPAFPDSVTVSGTGTDSDLVLTYNGMEEGKPIYQNNGFDYDMQWNGTEWYYSTNDGHWTNSTDSIYPPKAGWSLGLPGDVPAPELSFELLFGYDGYAQVPGDMIRLVDLFADGSQRNDGEAWVIEGGYILSNHDTLYLKYIAKPADTTDLDPLCANALICNLALKLCVALQLDDDWYARINNELYAQILPQARSIDTMENKELLLEESSWLLARNENL